MNALKPLSILSIALLTACAPPKPTTTEQLPVQRGGAPSALNESNTINAAPNAQKLAATTGPRTSSTAISSWEVSGAMAARNKNKTWTASVNWSQHGANNYQIRLFGPLGSGTVLIDKKNNMVTLRDGPKVVSSQNAESLLLKETGIGLPVHNLYYWVRGVPAPGAVQTANRDPNNRLTLLKQSGYTIEYPSYTTVSNMDLPNQIRLQGKGIFIKMIIKKWRV